MWCVRCKIPWPFFSRKPPALTSKNRRKSAINPEIASVKVLFSANFPPFSVEILAAPLQIGTHKNGSSAQFPANKGPGNLTPKMLEINSRKKTTVMAKFWSLGTGFGGESELWGIARGHGLRSYSRGSRLRGYKFKVDKALWLLFWKGLANRKNEVKLLPPKALYESQRDDNSENGWSRNYIQRDKTASCYRKRSGRVVTGR